MGDGFFGSSLSFSFTSNPSNLYVGEDGHVVDTTELPAAFYRKLLARHTVPGDWVLDLCSGSGALAWEASNFLRNVIAVESDEKCFHSICTRLRGSQELHQQNDKELMAITAGDDEAQDEMFENHDDSDEDDGDDTRDIEQGEQQKETEEQGGKDIDKDTVSMVK